MRKGQHRCEHCIAYSQKFPPLPLFRLRRNRGIAMNDLIFAFARIVHHDLRHLFATTCIEAGVDIPTVSRRLGHKDGGALTMKTYGHLRDEHSTAAAKKGRARVAAVIGQPEFLHIGHLENDGHGVGFLSGLGLR